MKIFNVPMMVLRDTAWFFEDIRKGLDLKNKIPALCGAVIAFFCVYGFILGAFHSVAQAFSSAIKLPLLFLATHLICFPALYVFNMLFGSRIRIDQYFTMLLGSAATMSVLMLGFAPIAFLYLITTDHYHFYKLLNVALFSIAGIVSVRFFYQGMLALNVEDAALKLSDATPERRPSEIGDETADTQQEVIQQKSKRVSRLESAPADPQFIRRRIIRVWIVLYAIVGSQLSWSLSPFLGDPAQPFMIIHDGDGNFFMNVLQALFKALGL